MTNKCVLMSYSGKLDCFDQLVPDLGIACLGRSLKEANFEYEFFDLNLLHVETRDAMEYIRTNDVAFVGLKLWPSCLREQIQVALEIKRAFPDIQIVGGGPLPRLFGELAFSFFQDSINILVDGEGEEAIQGICDYINGKRDIASIPNIIYKESGTIVKTPTRLLEPPDRIPTPAWEGIHLENYLPILPLNMKRGCQWSCSFCAHPHLWGRKADLKCLAGKSESDVRKENTSSVRKRPWESIRKEVELDYYKFGVNLIDIIDSTPDRSQLEHFCDYVAGTGLDIRWCCFGRMGLFDEAFFEKLRRGGNRVVWYGFEHGNNTMLKIMHKYFDVEIMKKTVSAARKAGIRTLGSFIVAHPGETNATLKDTLKFINEMNPDCYSISPFVLQPGSHIALSPREYGVKIDADWHEKLLQGLYSGKSPLDIHYFDVDGVPNDRWWRKFKPEANYRGWYDYRVADNMELVFLLAENLQVAPEKLATEVVNVLKLKDLSALKTLLRKAWASGKTSANPTSNVIITSMS